MAEKYRTATEAAMAFVLCCLRYAGIKEGGREHKELIGTYNTIKPLPYGYTMTVKDPWCAAFLSAIAKLLGYAKFPFECSCSRMLKKAQEAGLATWNRGYEPKVGDLLIYDLDGNGKADHIGVVVWVQGGKCWIVEGNYSNAVKVRCIAIDEPIVFAWICPDWMELVDNSNFVAGDRPNIPIKIPETKEEPIMIYNHVDELPEFAQEPVQDLVDIGAIAGVGDGNLGLNATQVRLAVWIWQVARHICKKLGIELK